MSPSNSPGAATVTASLLVAGALAVLLVPAGGARAQTPSGACADATEIAVMPSPIAPWKGAPLRVIFAAEKPLEGELSLIAPDGSVAAKSHVRHGGPPYFWFAEVASPAAGTWHVSLARENAQAGCGTITRNIAVRGDAPPMLLVHGLQDDTVWPKNSRNLATALAARGVAVTLKLYPKLVHADTVAALSLPARGRAPTLADIAAFVAPTS